MNKLENSISYLKMVERTLSDSNVEFKNPLRRSLRKKINLLERRKKILENISIVMGAIIMGLVAYILGIILYLLH